MTKLTILIDDKVVFETTSGDAVPPADSAPVTITAPAQKRGRGRPAKGEETTPAAPAPAPAAVEADPFETTPALPPPPTATLDEVRAALKALAAAKDQATALKVLADAGDGAKNLGELQAALYGAVVANAKFAMPTAAPAAPEADPFETPAAAPAPAVKAPTIEDVKAAIVAAQKRTSVDTVQKLLMQHGGKGKNPDTGAEAPSLKALPPEQFAATIAAMNALPGTK